MKKSTDLAKDKHNQLKNGDKINMQKLLKI